MEEPEEKVIEDLPPADTTQVNQPSQEQQQQDEPQPEQQQTLPSQTDNPTVSPPSNPPKSSSAAAELSFPPTQPSKKEIAKRERIEKLDARIRNDPFEFDTWSQLLTEVQSRGTVDEIRRVYERFLKQFPTSSRHWINYVEFELKNEEFERVESIFARCLKTVLSVDLWRYYINYIRRINGAEKGSTGMTPEARTTVDKAYELVINKVGMDREAGSIWSDYLLFIKSGETQNTWEEQRKMDKLRQIYQRAICIPLNNVEVLWKEYDQFENSLNKITAKKFLAEKSSYYMTARTVLREMRIVSEGLVRGGLPRPPQWTEKEIIQLEIWKRYIAWERSNPLQLEDSNMLADRVNYAYHQALLHMRYYPELWYDFARYRIEHNQVEQAALLLKDGMEVLPTSYLLHFAYVEIEESRSHITECHTAFESILNNLTKVIEEVKSNTEAELKALEAQLAEAEKESDEKNMELDGEMRERLREKEREKDVGRSAIEERQKEQIDALARGCSLVWIMYMNFAKRAEGITGARQVFRKARKFEHCTYHVFLASALMEYFCSKDRTVAGKIFEFGLKSFSDDPDYAAHYLEFLLMLNDSNNARALFERVLVNIPSEKARILWDRLMEYENRYGELVSIQTLDRRRAEVYTEETDLDRFVARCSYEDIDVIQEKELGGAARRQIAKETPRLDLSELAAEKDRYSRDEDKRPLLESYHPERFPRPDLTQWTPYKASPEDLKRAALDNMERAGSPAVGTPPPTGGDISSRGGETGHTQPVWISTGAMGYLPEAVANFLTALPPANTFNGPVFNASALLEVLMGSQIASAIMPPLPSGAGASRLTPPLRDDRGGHSPGRYGRNGRDGVSGRGRSKFKGGGGGGGSKRGGTKRKGDREHEDDDREPRGIGPNRPPEYDLFRARQQKRHRDEGY
ncbi:uncharacterized protein VTP21DRAFT_4144 [Calcarisporiella thermophila]|uniref:uncharacterized protein n=1 Tax=Calcarisporiella thermophila TaxID=911321 RepID=UPI00374253A4